MSYDLSESPAAHLAHKYGLASFPDLRLMWPAMRAMPCAIYGLRAVSIAPGIGQVGEAPRCTEGEHFAAAVQVLVPAEDLQRELTSARFQRNLQIAVRQMWQYALAESTGDVRQSFELLVLGGEHFVDLDSGDFDVGMVDSRIVYRETLTVASARRAVLS